MSSEKSKRPSESFYDHGREPIVSGKTEDSQQREILRRLHECDLKPDDLEPFEEADLERMIQEVSRKF